MVFTISHTLYNELCHYCHSKLPQEACGFITGFPKEDGFQVVSFLPITNIASNPMQHFMMNPLELIPILYKRDDLNLLIGIFHSHPTKEAVPSQEDERTEWHSLPSYWIVSFEDHSQPILQIFEIKKANQASTRKLSFVIDQ